MVGNTFVNELENRESASHAKKKLCTAVSVEAPDVFRILGVPCIDRGPDKMRPPVVYEHWKASNKSDEPEERGNHVQKKTANFARPSSVSADTPNFFKVRDQRTT